MKAALTGGTGFVGATLIDLLLREGWDVAALARDPARLPHADKVHVVKGPLEDEAALTAIAQDADVFFHLAGLTHARSRNDYERVNVAGAEAAARAAAGAGAKLVHASSMSARQPGVSPYAKSKSDSESAVAKAGDAWVALRLPAIYGPRDMVTLPFFKLVKSGFALAPKTEPAARASILYVEDAANALLAAAQVPAGAVYEVGDERAEGWAWTEIGAALGEVLGKRPRPIAVPRGAIAAYHGAVRTVEGALGRAPSVREGQINEFFHPDWVARENLLSDATGWRPRTPLKEGFAKTACWYQERGLL